MTLPIPNSTQEQNLPDAAPEAYMALRNKVAALQALAEISREITATMELPGIFDLVCCRAAELLDVPKAMVIARTSPDDDMRLSASYGLLDPIQAGQEFARQWRAGLLRSFVDRQRVVMGVSEIPADDPYIPQARRREAVRAYAYALLMADERLMGSLVICDTSPRAWSEDELQILSLMAGQVAVAMDRTRLYQETRTRAEQLALLYEAGMALNREMDPGVQLKVLFEITMKALRADRVEFFGYHQDNNAFEFEMGVGYDNEAVARMRQIRFPLGQERGLVGLVGLTRQPLYLAYVCDDPRWLTIDSDIRCGLWVAVERETHLHGVLGVFSIHPDAFTSQDEQLLTLFANQAAAAMENARLFEAQRSARLAADRQRELAETLREAFATLTASLDVEVVLDRLLEQVNRIVPSDAVNVMLVKDGLVRVARWRGYERFGAETHIATLSYSVTDTPTLRYMSETRRPVVVLDTHADARWVPHQEMSWLRSYAAAPIYIRDHVIGFLNADSATPGFFDHMHAERLRVFADGAAIAMENARLYEAAHSRTLHLATLNEIGQAVTSELDLDHVLLTLLESVRRATQAEACSVALVESEAAARSGAYKLVFHQATGDPGQAVVGLQLEPNQGIAGWVVAHRRSVLVLDALTDTRFYGNVDSGESFLTRDLVCVPLLARDAVIGVLELVNKQNGKFSQDDVQLLESVASQAAIAVENARLFAETRRRLRELEIISDVALVGAAGQPLDETVARARLTLNGLWPEAQVNFLFVDEAGQALRQQLAELGNPTQTLPGRRSELEDGLMNWVVREQCSVRVNDAGADARYSDSQPALGSEIAAPLLVGQRVTGVVRVQNACPNAFSEDDLRLLTTLAGQLATIFEKARLDAALARYAYFLEQRVDERMAELSAANADLARAARLKDEFLASMSHELRTPLTAILGMAEALQEEVFGALTPQQLKPLQTIEDSGRHLLALINDILDLSKIEAGKMELQWDTVPLSAVCKASLQFIKQDAARKSIKVSFVLDEQVESFQADQRRLKQILVNLLSNAVKFTPAGGEVGLKVQGDATLQVVNFVVWDTGIGIAQEDMGRMFKPFVQLDSRLSRQYAGTGLGLSLVYRMAEMHGGGVSVESQLGRGSRFTVSLPWYRPYAATIQAEEATQLSQDQASVLPPTTEMPFKGMTKPTLLLAEDHEASLVAVSEYLSKRGYRMLVARDGFEAVMLAETEHPALILMDIQMPGMDGLEAIRHIRARPEWFNIPILALTALVMPGDHEQCLAAGASAYISKPVSLSRLVEIIEAHLHSGGCQ